MKSLTNIYLVSLCFLSRSISFLYIYQFCSLFFLSCPFIFFVLFCLILYFFLFCVYPTRTVHFFFFLVIQLFCPVAYLLTSYVSFQFLFVQSLVFFVISQLFRPTCPYSFFLRFNLYNPLRNGLFFRNLEFSWYSLAMSIFFVYRLFRFFFFD